ncbi:CHAT domain-containing protein [Oxynema sp. CENA135]|uniref:CHAT domain-containing protein n=1 Tax=Oxynema sp. CENA135 TaxID=984206 RepID=UPI00190D68BA|nr:CHAT domain-containing protein [Oxynema sp. CENA135]MBK4729952.1 CHAT domain-containing protein [Oxynema sp. CENA135]
MLTDSSQLVGNAIRTVGEALFDCLFDSQLREHFLTYYRELVLDKQQNLEIILAINETALPELVAYPWEFICLPKRYQQGEIRWATDPKLSFFRTRYNLQDSDRRSLQIEPEKRLKIALVVARPIADSQLKNVEYRQVESHLSHFATQHTNIDFLPVINPATPRKVSVQLRDGQPDIFHFIGHGQLGQVALVAESGEPDWKTASFFSNLFNQHRPKIVILQACETAQESELAAFSSVAAHLMLQGIAIVIAMQYKIANQTASRFVGDFYDEIIKGHPVDVAVQQARFNLSLDKGYEQKDFATPILYMNSRDGYLFSRAETPDDDIIFKEDELLDILEQMIPVQFNRLLFKLKVPKSLMPSPDKPQTERAIALLEWATAPGGCGLENINNAVNELLK